MLTIFRRRLVTTTILKNQPSIRNVTKFNVICVFFFNLMEKVEFASKFIFYLSYSTSKGGGVQHRLMVQHHHHRKRQLPTNNR